MPEEGLVSSVSAGSPDTSLSTSVSGGGEGTSASASKSGAGAGGGQEGGEKDREGGEDASGAATEGKHTEGGRGKRRPANGEGQETRCEVRTASVRIRSSLLPFPVLYSGTLPAAATVTSNHLMSHSFCSLDRRRRNTRLPSSSYSSVNTFTAITNKYKRQARRAVNIIQKSNERRVSR